MTEHMLIGLAAIALLGNLAQWLAWRLRLPSILLLLSFGFLAGPVTGLLHPDELFGPALLPLVSFVVALILFEGGLSLRLSELRAIGDELRSLVTIGALATWAISAVAAHYILGLDWSLATLLGAILVVTGPTVIGPLLNHVRPSGRTGPLLKWEGIVIDPIGATLAVLVFEVILAGELGQATSLVLAGILRTVLLGGLIGLLGAAILVVFLRRYWVPDWMQNPTSLTVVVGVFAAANLLQEEAGLLAVTVMGVALANQRIASVKHIIEFKENLRVLLLSGLFIVLAARLPLSSVSQMGLDVAVFLAVLIFVARPAAVGLATWRSRLSWQERLFVTWMAPRGIVAAAVASIFAFRLTEAGHPQAEQLASLTFAVIVVTVILYGLTAAPVARRLGVARAVPTGFLIVGAHDWARAIALRLQNCGFAVQLVDTNWDNVGGARMAGLPVRYGSVLSEAEDLDLEGLGRLLALTSNDEVNSLAVLHFSDVFGRANVYQLAAQNPDRRRTETVPRHLRGRVLFSANATFARLADRFAAGATVRTTSLTREFDFGAFCRLHDDNAFPLFVIRETGELAVFTADDPPSPRPGQTLISLVNAAGREPQPSGAKERQGEP